MLFNSYEFIAVFLPITLALFLGSHFFLNKKLDKFFILDLLQKYGESLLTRM